MRAHPWNVYILHVYVFVDLCAFRYGKKSSYMYTFKESLSHSLDLFVLLFSTFFFALHLVDRGN